MSKHPTAATQPAWQSGWRMHALALGVLVLVSLAFFAPIHFSGRAIVATDTVGWRAMAESILAAKRATGQAALWATNAFAGMPAYMISYAPEVWQVDDLFRLLRRVMWPSSHFIVLLAGTYVAGWLLTRRVFAALLAAVSFGFTTYLPLILTVELVTGGDHHDAGQLAVGAVGRLHRPG